MAGNGDKQGASSARRDAILSAITARIPYLSFLGIRFLRRGDRLTAVLPFQHSLIGNPIRRALHGGATAGFLEATAIVDLAYTAALTKGPHGPESAAPELAALPLKLPETIDLRVDYLRPGRPCEARARARILRIGRRFASIHVEAWQDDRRRPFAHATGQFLMPNPDA